MHQKSKPSHAAPFAWVELALLLALAPLLLLPGRLLPIGWHPLLLGLIVLLRVTHLVVLRTPWPSSPLDLSTLLVVASLPMAIFISVDKPLSWSVAGYIVLGIALFFALANWPRTPHTPMKLFWLMMAMAGAMLLAGLSVVAGSPSLPDLPPALAALLARTGDIANVNIFTSLVAFLWPFALAPVLIWRRDRYWWVALLGAAGCLVFGYLIVAGGSRSGLISVAAAAGVLLLARWPRLLYSLVAAPLLIAGLLTYFPPVDAQAVLVRVLSIGVLSGRQEIWMRALAALEDFSYTGVGLGLFGQVIPALYPYDLLPGDAYRHAHNVYLQVGLDLGMAGQIAYISLWVLVVALLVGVLRRPASPAVRTLALGSLGASATLIINGLVDAAMWGTKLSFLPWLLFALVVQLSSTDNAPDSARN